MDQVEFFHYTIRQLERLALPYMMVGSYGCSVHGESRHTHDIDIVIDVFPFHVPMLAEAFPDPEFYLSREAVLDAIRNRHQFNVLHPASGNKIDFMLTRNDEWGRSQLSRRIPIKLIEGLQANVASPEDMIIGKLWYYSEGGSDKHIRDILGILKRSGDRVKKDEITRWALKLGYSTAWEECLAKWRAISSSEN